MYKKIVGFLAIVVISVVVAINANMSSTERFSDIGLANVEALAGGENPLGDCRYDPGYYCCIYWYDTGELDCTPYNWNWW